MASLPLSTYYQGIPPTFQWPVNFCLANSVVAFVLGVVTGNVSQVDRVWTFLPTIYAAYYALLPLWPSKSPLPLFPYVPDIVNPTIVERFSPRAVLMFGLIVSLFGDYPALQIAHTMLVHLYVPGRPISTYYLQNPTHMKSDSPTIHGGEAYSTCNHFCV